MSAALIDTFDRPQWQARGACVGADPDLFFPERGDHAAIQAALAICATCTVRAECLDYALTTRQNVGILGGTTASQRKQTLRSRRTAQ